MVKTRTFIFIIIFLQLVFSCAYKQNSADLLIYNGTIFLHGDESSQVKALVIDNGIVINYGPKEEMRNLYRYKSELNLKGKTLFPLPLHLGLKNKASNPPQFLKALRFRDTIIMAIKDTIQYAKIGDQNIYYTPAFTSRYPFDLAFLTDTIFSLPPNKPQVINFNQDGLKYEDEIWDFNKDCDLTEYEYWVKGVNFIPQFVKCNSWGLDIGEDADFLILNRSPEGISNETPLEIHEIYKKGKITYNFLYE